MFGRKGTGFNESFDTLIGSNAEFKGSINLEGAIRVDGKIKGDLNIEGDVFIGSEAVVTGNITAQNVRIAGTVEGNIHASGILKILSSSRLYGDIEVSSFVTDEGALFHGNCSMIQTNVDEGKSKRRSRRSYKRSTVLDQIYDEKEKNEEIEDE